MKLIIVSTLTVTVIAGIIGVAQWIFGATVAGIIGLGLAGIATKIYEAFYRIFPDKDDVGGEIIDTNRYWMLFAGILIIQASPILNKLAIRIAKLLNHGDVPISWWFILLALLFELIGYAICGYVVGKVVKERVIMVTSIGLIILFSIHIIDVSLMNMEKFMDIAKKLMYDNKIDNEKAMYLRIGGVISFIPSSFVSLYASALGEKHHGA